MDTQIIGLLFRNADEQVKRANANVSVELGFTLSDLEDELQTYPSTPFTKPYLLDRLISLFIYHDIEFAEYEFDDKTYLVHDRFYTKSGDEVPQDAIEQYTLEFNNLLKELKELGYERI